MNHEGGCKTPHGHNYAVEVTINGNINTLENDSSSYDVGSQYRNFLLSHYPNKKIRLLQESDCDWKLPWFCNCKVCQTMDYSV